MLRNLNFKRDIFPFLIATIGEFIALYFWLKYMDQDQVVLANLLLWLGFAIERISVAIWIRKVYNPAIGITRSSYPIWKQIVGLALITLSEILVWLAWFWVATKYGHLAGFGVLYVLMTLEHSMEMALIKQESIFNHIGSGYVHIFTFIEVIGGVGWLYFHMEGEALWSVLCLLVGLSLEHLIQGGQLKPEPTLKVEEEQKERIAVN